MKSSSLSLSSKLYLFIIVPATVIGWLAYGEDFASISCGILFTLLFLFPMTLNRQQSAEYLEDKMDWDRIQAINNNEV